MDFSELLIYGGIAGMAGCVVIGIIVILLMAGRKKRLQKKLNQEYGENAQG